MLASDYWISRRALWLGWFATACVVLFLLLYLLAVQTEWGQRAGNAALAGRMDLLPPLLITGVDTLLATINNRSLALLTGLLSLIGFVRGGIRLGVTTGAVILTANVTTQVLKRVVLDRPELSNAGEHLGATNSLPSGHATVAMSLSVAIALISPARLRPLIVIPATAYALAVGGATVTGGWHRPSDVITAYLVAIATAAAGGALLLMARRPGTRHELWHRRQARSSWPFWIAVIALAAALFTVSIIILVSTVIGLRWDQLGGAEFNIAYFAGMTASTAAGVFLMASLIALFSGIDFGGVNG